MKSKVSPGLAAAIIVGVVVIIVVVGWLVMRGQGGDATVTEDAMDTVDEGMMDQMEQEAADTGEDKSGIDDAGGAM